MKTHTMMNKEMKQHLEITLPTTFSVTIKLTKLWKKNLEAIQKYEKAI